MAEQLICNQQVDGSTPFTSSNVLQLHNGGFPERPKGADCKSVVNDFAGPNPASPTTKKDTNLGVLFCALCGDADSVCLSMLCIGIWFVHFGYGGVCLQAQTCRNASAVPRIQPWLCLHILHWEHWIFVREVSLFFLAHCDTGRRGRRPLHFITSFLQTKTQPFRPQATNLYILLDTR